MKKLMIAACAVALSAAAQAATFNWTWSTSDAATTPFSATTPSGKSDGTIYFITGFTGGASTDVNPSKIALLAALRATGVTDFDAVVKGTSGYAASKTLTNGALGEQNYQENVGGKQYAYSVILDQDDSGNQWAYISAMKSATGVDSEEVGSGTFQFVVSKTDMYNLENAADGKSAGWYQLTAGAGPVPEPTSGLLLLLGVAGLALKRKRA